MRRRLLIALAVVMGTFAVALVLVLANPGWVIETATPSLLAFANEELAGTIRVEEVEAHGWSDLELRGVRIETSAGNPAVEASRVRVRFAPLELLSARLLVSTLDVDSASVDFHPDGPGPVFSDAFDPVDDDEEEDPPRADRIPIFIRVSNLRVRDASFSVIPGETRQSLHALSVSGAMRLNRSGELRAELTAKNEAIDLEAKAERFDVFELSGSLDAQGEIGSALVRRWSESYRCTTRFEIHGERPAASDSWSLRAQVTADGQAFDGAIRTGPRFDHRSSRLTIESQGVERCLALGVAGTGKVEIANEGPVSNLSSRWAVELRELRADGRQLGRFEAAMETTLSDRGIEGTLPRLRWASERFDLTGELRRFRFGSRLLQVEGLALRERRGRLDAELTLDPRSPLGPGTKARIVGHVEDLSPWSPLLGTPLAGAVEVNANLAVRRRLEGEAAVRAERLQVGSVGPLEAFVDLRSSATEAQGQKIRFFGNATSARGAGELRWEGASELTELPKNLPSLLATTWTRVDVLGLELAPWIDGVDAQVSGEVDWRRSRLTADLAATVHEPTDGQIQAAVRTKSSGLELELDLRDPGDASARIEVRSTAGPLELLSRDLLRETWQIELQTKNIDGTTIARYVPALDGLKGELAAEASLEVRELEPRGVIAVNASALQLNDSPPLDVSATLHAIDHQLDSNFGFSGVVTGDARLRLAELPEPQSLSLDTLRDLEGSFRITAADTEALSQWLLEREVSGRVRAEGTIGAGAIELDAQLKQIRTAGVVTPLDGTLWVRSFAEETLASFLIDDDDLFRVNADGRVGADLFTLLENPDPALPYRVTLDAQQLPLSDIPALAALRGHAAGSLTISAEFEGDQKDWRGSANASVAGAIFGSTVFEELKADATLGPERVALQALAVTGPGSRLSIEGSSAVGERDLELRILASRFPLDWLYAVSLLTQNGRYLLGRLDSDLRVRMTPDRVRLDGTVDVRDASGVVLDELPRLENVSLSGRFDEKRSRLEGRATAGRGTLELTFSRQPGERGEFDGSLTLDRVPLSSGGLLLQCSARIDATGALVRDTGRVDASIGDARIQVLRQDPDLHPTEDAELIRYVDAEAERLEDSKGTSAPFELDFSVRTLAPIRFEGDSVSTPIAIDQEGHLGREGLRVTGEIWVPSYGEIKVGRHRYEIERAKAIFSRDQPFNPTLDISLMHAFRNPATDFYVRVFGRLADPKLRFESSPAIYDQSEHLNFFAGGKPSERVNTSSAAATSVVSSYLTSKVETDIKRALPVDTFEVDVGDGSQPATLTTGKWLSESLFVAYTFRIGSESSGTAVQNRALLRYRFPRGISLEMEVVPGEDASGAVDLMWVRRF